MQKDWTGGKLLDGKLDGWMKMAKKDEISWEKHISIQRVFFKMLFLSFSNGEICNLGSWQKILNVVWLKSESYAPHEKTLG